LTLVRGARDSNRDRLESAELNALFVASHRSAKGGNLGRAGRSWDDFGTGVPFDFGTCS
jgi:hypothetical protein